MSNIYSDWRKDVQMSHGVWCYEVSCFTGSDVSGDLFSDASFEDDIFADLDDNPKVRHYP